jgi:tetratricopeptide (TPR) repeat protein
MMWFYKKLLIYRLYIGIPLLIGAIALAFLGDNWGWFTLCLTLGLIAVVSHFLFGPLRLIQEAVEAGDMEAANKYLNMVQFPRLLIKPVRQGYYMIKSNLAMQNKDFNTAEGYLKESIKSKSSIAGQEFEGASYLQLGMLAMQKGDRKEAKRNLRQALSKGLPDDDSMAAALLQLASIEIQGRQLKQGKEYFKKAKKLKVQNPEIKEQLVQMGKYISRVR